ncbi:MAG: hypothetical protein ACW96U_00990 [Candidatus Heimdallarchaeaceae archaeon]|jgi:hypothetical protein
MWKLEFHSDAGKRPSDEEFADNYKHARITTAVLLLGDDEFKQSQVVCHYLDQDCKVMGQYESVKKLLSPQDERLNKEQRKEIWNLFFNHSKKTKRLKNRRLIEDD